MFTASLDINGDISVHKKKKVNINVHSDVYYHQTTNNDFPGSANPATVPS